MDEREGAGQLGVVSSSEFSGSYWVLCRTRKIFLCGGPPASNRLHPRRLKDGGGEVRERSEMGRGDGDPTSLTPVRPILSGAALEGGAQDPHARGRRGGLAALGGGDVPRSTPTCVRAATTRAPQTCSTRTLGCTGSTGPGRPHRPPSTTTSRPPRRPPLAAAPAAVPLGPAAARQAIGRVVDRGGADGRPSCTSASTT